MHQPQMRLAPHRGVKNPAIHPSLADRLASATLVMSPGIEVQAQMQPPT